MSDMPPQVVRQDVTRIGASGERRPGDDLPVLNAFQRFLEMERARARRKMAGLAAALALGLTCILVAGATGMLFIWMRARQGMSEWEARTREAISRAEQRSVQVEAAMNKAIEETRQWTLSLEARSRESEGKTREDVKAEVAALRAALLEMTKANEIFRSEITGIREQIPQLSNVVWRLARRGEPSVSQDQASTGPNSVASQMIAEGREPVRAYVRFAPADLIIALTPTNGSRTVAWCLPIPE